MIRYLHINWVANQVFNTSNSNVLGSHVHVNEGISMLVLATRLGVECRLVSVRAKHTKHQNTNREQTLFQVFHDIEGS